MGAHVCPWWLGYLIDNPLRRLLHRPEAMLRPYVRPGATAMDVGCGMGFFSLGLAHLVGEGGRVLAVDLQPRMLAVVRRRAARMHLAERIETRLCSADDLGVREAVDFVLLFYMAHEVGDVGRFLGQVRATLAPEGRVLLVEPPFHVTAEAFAELLRVARDAGLVALARPRIPFSRAALLAVPA